MFWSLFLLIIGSSSECIDRAPKEVCDLIGDKSLCDLLHDYECDKTCGNCHSSLYGRSHRLLVERSVPFQYGYNFVEAPSNKHRCNGSPPNDWYNLGRKHTAKACAESCLFKNDCRFAVYDDRESTCTEFSTCDSFFKTETEWIIFKMPPAPLKLVQPYARQTNANFRCGGEPRRNQWNNFGEKNTPDECAAACLKKRYCFFTLYEAESKQCTQFNECDDLKLTESKWQIFEVQESETIPVNEASQLFATTKHHRCSGTPKVGWNNFGRHNNAQSCANNCKKKLGCEFVVFNEKENECTEFSSCKQFMKRAQATWIIFKVEEVERVAAKEVVLVHTAPSKHHRCLGSPLGAWNNFGVKTTGEKCAGACLAKSSCRFVTYEVETGGCTEYESCYEFYKTDSSWKNFKIQGTKHSQQFAQQ